MLEEILEADGSMSDIGGDTPNVGFGKRLITPTPVKKKKCKKDDKECEDKLNEFQGDKDAKNKKMASKISKAKNKIKCKGDYTPHLENPGAKTPRFKCKPKDKKLARTLKKSSKKFNRTAAAKKSRKKATATKKFRYKI
ncbi:MAG: hypothetical protein KAI79_01235 [Bacteroidales bacterium]|nr:hypothetical protein [Bacteroidales bacterium]